MTENGDSDSEEFMNLFPEPEGYYKPLPEPTTESFTQKNAKNPYSSCKFRL
jgi:hypothetical protein